MVFVKGVSGNPLGKRRMPHLERKKIMSKAAEDYEEFYAVLREKALVDKEPWAMKLFFEHLPREIKESKKVFKIYQDTTSLSTQIESVRIGLAQVEEHDIDSATLVLRALTSTKAMETDLETEMQIEEDERETREKLDKIISMYEKNNLKNIE